MFCAAFAVRFQVKFELFFQKTKRPVDDNNVNQSSNLIRHIITHTHTHGVLPRCHNYRPPNTSPQTPHLRCEGCVLRPSLLNSSTEPRAPSATRPNAPCNPCRRRRCPDPPASRAVASKLHPPSPRFAPLSLFCPFAMSGAGVSKEAMDKAQLDPAYR